jgi:hypothetical protein
MRAGTERSLAPEALSLRQWSADNKGNNETGHDTIAGTQDDNDDESDLCSMRFRPVQAWAMVH